MPSMPIANLTLRSKLTAPPLSQRSNLPSPLSKTVDHPRDSMPSTTKATTTSGPPEPPQSRSMLTILTSPWSEETDNHATSPQDQDPKLSHTMTTTPTTATCTTSSETSVSDSPLHPQRTASGFQMPVMSRALATSTDYNVYIY